MTTSSNHSEPNIDEVWFLETNPSGIGVHIHELQAQHPTVVIDIPSHLSLTFPLGSSTDDVMLKAKQGYSNMSQELKSIKNYLDIILDAYNATIAYDKAVMFLYQFNTTGKTELLREAHQTLRGLILYSSKSIQLLGTICELAKNTKHL